MGTLADVLNAPLKVDIAGQSFTVRRLSAAKIYTHIEDALRELDPKLKGMELQTEAQDCIESGKYPVQSIGKFLLDGSDDLDEDDVRALTSENHLTEALQIAKWIVGLVSDIKKKEVKSEPKPKAK